jgi:hypothetical protein
VSTELTSPADESTAANAVATGSLRVPSSLIRRALGLVALAILSMLPAVLPLMLIARDGVDVPYYDQWEMVRPVVDAHRGIFPPTNLFAQHNEHRVVIPRLIYVLLGNLTQWRMIDDMIMTFILVCITSACVLYLCSTTTVVAAEQENGGQRSRTATVFGLWLVCNVLMFSPMQHENWLWGIGVMNVLPMMFIAAAMAVFVAPRLRTWTKMALCLLLATAATFSSGNGMLAWPLLGVLWLWSRSRPELKHKKWLVLAWVLGTIANALLYFHNYHKPQHATVAYARSTGAVVQYIFAFLGAAVGFGTATAAVMASEIAGAIFVLLLAAITGWMLWNWWRTGKRNFDLHGRLLLWLMVAGFTVASAVLAGVTRAGFSVEQALSSRYLTFSIYLPIALVNMLFILARQQAPPGRRVVTAINTSLITTLILLTATSITYAFNSGDATRIQRLEAKGALLMINIVPENERNQAILYTTESKLRAEANELNELGWLRPPLITSSHARDILAANDPTVVPAGVGKLEQFGRESKDRSRAIGWAVRVDRDDPADSVFLTWDRMDNDPVIFAMATMGVRRDDIAQNLNDSNYANSGWYASFPTSRLPPGNDRLRIRAWSFDVGTGKATQLDGEATLQR